MLWTGLQQCLLAGGEELGRPAGSLAGRPAVAQRASGGRADPGGEQNKNKQCFLSLCKCLCILN